MALKEGHDGVILNVCGPQGVPKHNSNKLAILSITDSDRSLEVVKVNLEYLNTFIEVARLESLSSAAKKLSLSQPAVSLQIQKLEKELGYRLIERDAHRFLLTTQGKRFFRFAEYVYQEHKHLVFDMAQIEKGVTGCLSVAASPVVGEFVVPHIISKFKEDHPGIDIIVSIMDSPRVVTAVAENPNIIGFTGSTSASPDINFFKLGEEEMSLIVYPGHPFVIKKQVTVADLIGETIIIRAETRGRPRFYSRMLNKAGLDLDTYHPKIVMGTTTGVISAVEAKAGIGFVSSLSIKNSDALGMIKTVKIKNVRLRHQYQFIHNKNVDPDPLMANFIGFIHQLSLTYDND
jgi:DNA-binding transcriptional LysR family regulator